MLGATLWSPSALNPQEGQTLVRIDRLYWTHSSRISLSSTSCWKRVALLPCPHPHQVRRCSSAQLHSTWQRQSTAARACSCARGGWVCTGTPSAWLPAPWRRHRRHEGDSPRRLPLQRPPDQGLVLSAEAGICLTAWAEALRLAAGYSPFSSPSR